MTIVLFRPSAHTVTGRDSLARRLSMGHLNKSALLVQRVARGRRRWSITGNLNK